MTTVNTEDHVLARYFMNQDTGGMAVARTFDMDSHTVRSFEFKAK